MLSTLFNRLPSTFPKKRELADGVIRLNLGSGDKVMRGYISVDIVDERAGAVPDVQADVTKRLPFEDNYADEILSVHCVEHFDQWIAQDVISEWCRVLKPGGAMIIECPNLLSACKEVLKNPKIATRPDKQGQRSMWVLYGDPAWKDPLMCHKWAYTPATLIDLMKRAGLQNVQQEKAQFKQREPRDMRVVGYK